MDDDADNHYSTVTDAVAKTYASDEWKQAMAANGLAPLDMTGDEFEAFVKDSIDNITDLSKQIGLIK